MFWIKKYKFFIKFCENIIYIFPYEGDTALLKASKIGLVTIVESLLNHPDIDVHVANGKGNTALMNFGCHHGRLRIVKCLLNAPGIDINQPNNEGVTVLMRATLYSCDDVSGFQSILSYPGVNVNQVDNDGWTALMYACCHHGGINRIPSCHRLVDLLLEHPSIDACLKNKKGRTALDCAICYHGQCQMVDILSKYLGITPMIPVKQKKKLSKEIRSHMRQIRNSF